MKMGCASVELSLLSLSTIPIPVMRYRLRTLLILMAVVAPLMLFAGWCVIWAILVTKISLP